MKAAALLASRPGLVFDLDGTLVQTADDLWLALNAALRGHGLQEVAPELVLQSLHHGLEGTAAAALHWQQGPAPMLPALARSYAQHYAQRAHADSVLYEGVAELLEACRSRGAAMAVCTNKGLADAQALLRRLGILGYFRSITAGDTAPQPKPHPSALWQSLEALRVPPAEAVLIGDSHVDAQCASRAGVDFILHAGGYGGAAVQDCRAAAAFRRYAELLARPGP